MPHAYGIPYPPAYPEAAAPPQAIPLVRTLHRWSLALQCLGGFLGLPATVLVCLALWCWLDPEVFGFVYAYPGARWEALQLPVVLESLSLLVGAMGAGLALCLSGQLVAARALSLQATVSNTQ